MKTNQLTEFKLRKAWNDFFDIVERIHQLETQIKIEKQETLNESSSQDEQ